jgi:hypothetical protein
VRHEELISGLVVSSVHGVVVDVHEDGSGSKQRCLGRVDERSESVDQDSGGRDLATDRGDSGLQTFTSGLSSSLKDADKDVRSRVDVLQSTDDDSSDGVGRVLSLEQTLCLDESSVQRLGLLESVDVIGTSLVGIGVLKGLGELVVDVLEDTNQASGKSNSVTSVLGFSLVQVIVLLGHDLLNCVASVLEQDADELVVFLSARDPRILRHGNEVLRVVETRGNEGEVYSDLLVCRRRDLEKLLQSSDGLGSVGVLKVRRFLRHNQRSSSLYDLAARRSP